MNSEYAQKLIKRNLLDKIESKLNICLSEDDKTFLWAIIRTSPSVLYIA